MGGTQKAKLCRLKEFDVHPDTRYNLHVCHCMTNTRKPDCNHSLTFLYINVEKIEQPACVFFWHRESRIRPK